MTLVGIDFTKTNDRMTRPTGPIALQELGLKIKVGSTEKTILIK
jgi:hypothetical protein